MLEVMLTALGKSVLELYARRDNLAIIEQGIEHQIFDVTKIYSIQQQEDLERQYHLAKDRRHNLSVRAAVAFMQLSLTEKVQVTNAWADTVQGLRRFPNPHSCDPNYGK